jgi:hypothetical protein
MLGALAGSAMLVLFLAPACLRIRSNRKSGKTLSFGHPMLDNLLLLISGLLLASVFALVIWLSRSKGTILQSRIVLYPIIISLGALLTWGSNRFLKRK